MTTILDGPAAGQTFMLTRTPIFLRVTEKNGKWDALNETYDEALPGEKLHAYLLVAHHGYACVDGKNFRGRCAMASYAYIDAQPTGDILRDNEQWAMWVTLAAKLKENIDRSTFIPKNQNQ
jgi:hypothetical protein